VSEFHMIQQGIVTWRSKLKMVMKRFGAEAPAERLEIMGSAVDKLRAE